MVYPYKRYIFIWVILFIWVSDPRQRVPLKIPNFSCGAGYILLVIINTTDRAL